MPYIRGIVVILIVVLCGFAPVFAEHPDEPASLKGKGSFKMWMGAALVGAGALALPVTALGNNSTTRDYQPRLFGVGLMAAGTAFIWLGAKERQKAMQPNTTIGINVGHTKSVQVRRSW